MEVERITIMKKLTNDEKEQITIYPYEKGFVNLYLFPEGVNVALEALGYKDRLIFDVDKGIFKWSTV